MIYTVDTTEYFTVEFYSVMLPRLLHNSANFYCSEPVTYSLLEIQMAQMQRQSSSFASHHSTALPILHMLIINTKNAAVTVV